ncbi:MAG: 50S ribosomal protein L19 [Deltaproteobacteria bacterium]|nr:50S ribosomal protein L19 [Deltaproteobacteria bacterium]
MNLLQTIEKEIVEQRTREPVDVRTGDTVRVHVRISESEKTRIQVFEGTVISIRQGGPRATFTVRKISSGVGVERIFPASSPNVVKVEVKSRHKVRRAKLYYLRSRRGKSARLREIRGFRKSAKYKRK